MFHELLQAKFPELVVSIKPPLVENFKFYHLIWFVVFFKPSFQRAHPAVGYHALLYFSSLLGTNTSLWIKGAGDVGNIILLGYANFAYSLERKSKRTLGR